MADVFISYAREDRARAEQVARGLEALGLEVFWDTDVPPGQTWADYIESKLAGCKAVIVLWSDNSTKSQWVREEARMGRESGKLIPAMIDASPPPFGFGEVQGANLSTWRGEPGHPDWQRLVEAVRSAAPGARARAEPSPPPASPPWRQQTDSQTAPGKGVNPIVIGGGLAAAAVVLAVALFAVGNRPQPANQPYVASPPAAAAPQQPVQQTSADSTPSYGAQVQERLMHATQTMAAQGFFPAAPQPFQGQLADDARQTFPLTLMSPGEYRLVGVCDRDCSDLDLYVKAPDGTVVAQDQQNDPIPIVALTQAYAAQGFVEVVMYNCSVSPCFYSVMLYGRQAGAQ
jgi:hypothetical protein